MLAFDDAGPVPLLLVHGHPFDRSMWRPQLSRFAAERRVLAPDLRGYGATGGAATRWTQLAEDLVTVLDAVRVPRAVVVGLSMGGQVALELHRIAPMRVAGLLLADTTAAAEHDRAGRIDGADRLEREGMDPYAVENLYRMVAPGAPAAPHVLAMMRAADPHGAAAAQRAPAPASPEERGGIGTGPRTRWTTSPCRRRSSSGRWTSSPRPPWPGRWPRRSRTPN